VGLGKIGLARQGAAGLATHRHDPQFEPWLLSSYLLSTAALTGKSKGEVPGLPPFDVNYVNKVAEQEEPGAYRARLRQALFYVIDLYRRHVEAPCVAFFAGSLWRIPPLRAVMDAALAKYRFTPHSEIAEDGALAVGLARYAQTKDSDALLFLHRYQLGIAVEGVYRNFFPIVDADAFPRKDQSVQRSRVFRSAAAATKIGRPLEAALSLGLSRHTSGNHRLAALTLSAPALATSLLRVDLAARVDGDQTLSGMVEAAWLPNGAKVRKEFVYSYLSPLR
jgi:hypothetical protein